LRGVPDLPATDFRAQAHPDRARRRIDPSLARGQGEPPLRSSPPDIPIEIAFLEDYGLPRAALIHASETARRCGVTAEAALLGEGWISEERFYRTLADRLGAPYYTGEPAFSVGTNPQAAIAAGFVALTPDRSGIRAVVAPNQNALRLLLEGQAAGRPQPPIAICSRQRLSALIRARFGERIARAAAFDLRDSDASLSASSGLSPAQIAAAFGLAAGTAELWLIAPGLLHALISVVLWLMFTGWIWLRWTAVAAADTPAPCEPLSDAELPVYTIVAALYREAGVADKLIRALDAIDYPRAKLDIKLVVERRDAETLAAIAAQRLAARYDIIVAPPGEPSTKPRALNVALGAARGDHIVVFDAEDEPAPDQLRLAAARFAADAEVDCLQARLTVENAGDSWVSALFAIEYAALFDLVNPGLGALDLPIALGGTSNHFRTQSLRRVGGWDAWNVAEDADLGIRLARFGARVATLDSDTWEEAPNDVGNWFRQRVRWQKGWMQTLIVHSRRPIRFCRELGASRALSAALLIGGTVFGGLFGAPLLLDTVWRSLSGGLALAEPLTLAGDVIVYLLLFSGLQAVVVPSYVAMRRRGMVGALRALVLTPAYYALICAATWVGLYELAVRPFHWGKTVHGRMRATRRPRRAAETSRGRVVASSAR
jgi:cellulose synthase/poly-beta-1,6-N-acetylglucosamine synthase-like glycosyltransferase